MLNFVVMRYQCSTLFKCMEIGFSDLCITFIQKCRFGNQNIGTASKSVDIFYEMCSQQTFCPVPVHCIADFLTGDKPYFKYIRLLIEKYEVGSMPGFGGVFVHPIELFTGLYPSKMFDLSDGYTASLFLPFALLAAMTFLPFFVFILVLKPCVLFLGVLWGWYVLFIFHDPSFFHMGVGIFGRDFT